MPDRSYSETIFIIPESSLFQFKAVSSGPLTAVTAESGAHLSITSSQETVESDGVPSEPPPEISLFL